MAATPSLLHRPRDIAQLKHVCDGLIIRRNEGYDYGSWMTGLRFCRDLIEQRQQLIITNDSFWGPVRPLDDLIRRLETSQADVIGLTDNLMYQPHLQSPFLKFGKNVIQSSAFWDFWDGIACWEHKRNIVKTYEVGLPVLLQNEGLKLDSLYSKNSNGNIFHADWRSLIKEQQFPFLKVSLLRDNPHQIDISDWEELVNQFDPRLTRQIQQQLEQHVKDLAFSRTKEGSD